MKIYFATSNRHKYEEICAFLPFKLHQLDIEITEIQGKYTEIITSKLHRAAREHDLNGDAMLVDDTSLSLHGLYGFPGMYTKDFLKIGYKNIENIVQKVGRDAVVSCYLGLLQNNEIKIFHGAVEGKIVPERPGRAFGFDSIFLFNDTKTFSEMTLEEKNSISHRGRACMALTEYLRTMNLIDKFE